MGASNTSEPRYGCIRPWLHLKIWSYDSLQAYQVKYETHAYTITLQYAMKPIKTPIC